MHPPPLSSPRPPSSALTQLAHCGQTHATQQLGKFVQVAAQGECVRRTRYYDKGSSPHDIRLGNDSGHAREAAGGHEHSMCVKFLALWGQIREDRMNINDQNSWVQ